MSHTAFFECLNCLCPSSALVTRMIFTKAELCTTRCHREPVIENHSNATYFSAPRGWRMMDLEEYVAFVKVIFMWSIEYQHGDVRNLY
jgi:hypothetical protein